MKLLKFIFATLFTLSIATTFAHKDFVVRKEFKNVKVAIKTGYNYEEIQKIIMIGELASNLLEKLNYKDTVSLDFIHIYTGKCNTGFFVSFDDGKIVFNSLRVGAYSKTKGIFIRQVGNSFDITSTLKLVEYAVKNRSTIEKNQKSLSYNKNFYDFTLNSIDTIRITDQLGMPSSRKVKKVLKRKIFRPETGKQDSIKANITYYYEKDRFYIAQVNSENPYKPILELYNIYAFKIINTYSALVFDSNNSFYYLNTYKNLVSKRHIIENLSEYYRPFVSYVSDSSKIGLAFTSPSSRNILLIVYRIEKDSVTVKIDKI